MTELPDCLDVEETRRRVEHGRVLIAEELEAAANVCEESAATLLTAANKIRKVGS